MMDEPRSEIDWRVVHTMQLGMSALIVFVMVVIWAVTGFGDLLADLGVVRPRDPGRRAVRDRRANAGPRQWRALNTHAALATVAGGILTFIWALTGFGIWLFWPLFGMSVALGLHALMTTWWRALHPERERS